MRLAAQGAQPPGLAAANLAPPKTGRLARQESDFEAPLHQFPSTPINIAPPSGRCPSGFLSIRTCRFVTQLLTSEQTSPIDVLGPLGDIAASFDRLSANAFMTPSRRAVSWPPSDRVCQSLQ